MSVVTPKQAIRATMRCSYSLADQEARSSFWHPQEGPFAESCIWTAAGCVGSHSTVERLSRQFLKTCLITDSKATMLSRAPPHEAWIRSAEEGGENPQKTARQRASIYETTGEKSFRILLSRKPPRRTRGILFDHSHQLSDMSGPLGLFRNLVLRLHFTGRYKAEETIIGCNC